MSFKHKVQQRRSGAFSISEYNESLLSDCRVEKKYKKIFSSTRRRQFLDEQKILVERLSKLDAVLSDVEDLKKNLASEVNKRKAAERKADELKVKLKHANKNRFGDLHSECSRKSLNKSDWQYANIFDK